MGESDKITVTGSMNTNADHAALVAKGDIKIHGNGPNSSRFRGLVYSEKSIDIAKTQIIGAAVSKDSAGTTKLEDVRAISVPELTKIEFETHITLDRMPISNDLPVGEAIGILESDGTFTDLTGYGDTESKKALGARLGSTDPSGQGWEFVIRKSGVDTTVAPPFTGIHPDLKLSWNLWRDYVDEHRDNAVKTEEIFSVDLNTLISLDQKLEMLFHTTVSIP